jgi:hypothetical protein
MRFDNGWMRNGPLRLTICAALSLAPAVAPAQSDSGWLFKPSLMAALARDDNVFFRRENPQQDTILRLSPAFETGYRSAPTAFNAYYTLDAHRYDRFPELDDDRVREHGELNFSRTASPRLTLTADASYTATEVPGELDARSGLELGRVHAERLYFSPGAIYRFDRLTVGHASYSFNRDDVEDRIGSDSHVLALQIDRMRNRRDTLSFGYRAESYDFEDGGRVDMHVFLAGGTRRFTPRTSLTLLAGPRFWEDGGDGDNEIDPEATATLRHAFTRGDFSLSYARSQTTVIGATGTAATQRLHAALTYPFGKDVGLRVESGFVSSQLRGLEADAVVGDIEIAWRLDDRLTLVGAWEFNSQRGSVVTPLHGTIDRNVFWIGLVLAPPVRTDSAWWRRERATSTVLDEPTLRRRE